MGKSTELRNKIIAKLAEALQTEPGSEGYTMEACAAIALEVEGAMDAAFSKEKEYMSKGRSLVFNLQKNAELRRNVLTRERTPSKGARCSPAVQSVSRRARASSAVRRARRSW